MIEEVYQGVPREKIPWDPEIDYEKCVICRKCVDFCHAGAFRIEEEGGQKRTEINPNRCVVFCRGCEYICVAGSYHASI